MALGTPYKICGGNHAAGATTLAVTVTTTTSQGDAIAVWVSNNAANFSSPAVSDSQNNTYAQAGSTVTNGQLNGQWWVALTGPGGTGPTKKLTASTDTITLTCTTTTGAKNLSAFGCSGVATSSAVDQTPTPTTGTSAAPSITSGTLAQASELCLAGLVNGNGGGAVTWGGTFTSPAASDSELNGTTEYGQAAAITVASTAAVTASGTIVSAAWGMVLVTLKAAVAPAPWDPPRYPQNTAGAARASYRSRYEARSIPAGGISQPPFVPQAVHAARRPPRLPPRGATASWAQGIAQPPIPPQAVRDTRRPVKVLLRSGIASWARGISQPPVPPQAVRDVRAPAWAWGWLRRAATRTPPGPTTTVTPAPTVPAAVRDTRRPVRPPSHQAQAQPGGGISQPPILPQAVHAARRPPRLPPKGSTASWAQGVSQPPVPPQAVRAARRPLRLPPWRAVRTWFPPAPSLPAATRDTRRPPRLPPKGSTAGWAQGVSQPPVPPQAVRAARRPLRLPRSGIASWAQGVSQPPPVPPAGQPRPRRIPWRRGIPAGPVPQAVIAPAAPVPVSPPRWLRFLPRRLRGAIGRAGTRTAPPQLVLFSVVDARQQWSVVNARQPWQAGAARQQWQVTGARNNSS